MPRRKETKAKEAFIAFVAVSLLVLPSLGACALSVQAPAPAHDALAAAGVTLAQGNWDSLVTYATMLRNDPQNAMTGLHMLMFAYLMEGRYNDILMESLQLRKAGVSGQLSGFYASMTSEYPSSVYVYLALGAAYSSEGNLTAAIKAFEKAREIDDKNPHVYSMLGATKRNAGEVEQAIALYLKAIELDNKLALAYVNLGAAYEFQKKFSDAERVLRKAVEIRSDYGMAWVNLGVAHRNLGSLDEAITCYKKAISLIPQYPSVYLNLGAAYFYRGEFDKARQAWEKVVELDPDGPSGASARRNLSQLPH